MVRFGTHVVVWVLRIFFFFVNNIFYHLLYISFIGSFTNNFPFRSFGRKAFFFYVEFFLNLYCWLHFTLVNIWFFSFLLLFKNIFYHILIHIFLALTQIFHLLNEFYLYFSKLKCKFVFSRILFSIPHNFLLVIHLRNRVRKWHSVILRIAN